ncbi:DUF523 domain-containing protein, partial [Candidatus Borrarchaeum sp.]|uniref:DUF523 domain-containing protein n=1 Tax=Candidatus Borrarchaeum sp. TaxID=2846742 RepID=UPI00257B15C8
MREFTRPNIVVSKCLGFAACRWNAEIIQADNIKKLEPYVNFIPVCPEVEIGLGIPRDPIQIVSMNGEEKLIQPASGNDLTEKMIKFTDLFLSSLDEIDGFILKSRSPSCGINDVKIYPSLETTDPISSNNSGFFGRRVLEIFPDLAINDECQLKDSKIRQDFLKKLFTRACFREGQKVNKIEDFVKRNFK